MPDITIKPDQLYFNHFPNSIIDTGWRWQLRAPNGKIIGGSTESYTEKRGMLANAARMLGRGAIAGDIRLGTTEQAHIWDWERALVKRYGRAHAEEYQ